MPQVYVILDPQTMALFTDDEVMALGRKLIPLVEKRFDIVGKDDVAFTAVRAVATINEAAVQVEVRYTAGKDEYGRGEPFDPSEELQKVVAESIKTACQTFFKDTGFPEYSVSVWPKPYYNSVFVD